MRRGQRELAGRKVKRYKHILKIIIQSNFKSMLMKRKLFKTSLLVIAFALIAASFAQQPVQSPHGGKSGKVVKSQLSPQNYSTSIKDVLFSEDFSGGLDDWTIVGEGLENWSISQTNQAGGEVPEARMTYSPVFLGTSRLVSPVINTSGYTELGLSFLHVLDLWSGGGGFWVSVETTSDGGTTWNPVWELYWETTDDYYAFEVLGINTPDVGSEDFQFCFKYEDNSDLLDWWKIDDVTLGDANVYDVTTTSIDGLAGNIYEGDPIDISGTVKNLGSETVSFDVKLEITEGSNIVFEDTKSVSDLAFGETEVVAFETWTSVEGGYTATVTTLLADDQNPDNDALDVDFSVLSSGYYCIPSGNCTVGDGIEDFIFAGIENIGSGCSPNGYGSFLGMTAEVEIGYTYTAQIKAPSYGDQNVTIWIDFNTDMEFTADERVLIDYIIPDPGVLYDVDITIPADATAASTFMRIGSAWNEPSSGDPCATLTYGEWEDYSIEVTGTLISYNAGVVSIEMNNYYEEGDITPMATVINQGLETISFPVTCTIGGYSSTQNVSDLAYNETVELEFDTWSATSGSYTVEVETGLTGDEIPSNDLLTKEVSVVPYLPAKRVVGEEGTGTWCGWCVRGIVFMEYMATTYPDTWIGIAVHNNDPMLIPEYDDGIGFSAFPSGIVDRVIDTDPSDFEAAYNARLAEIAPADIAITAKSFDETTGELTFTLSSTFVADVTNYRFLGVLIENFVTGTGPEWAQYNAYSGGAAGPMGGFENLPSPIPAEDMVYMDVARALLGPIDGVEGSLPASVSAGETHTFEFTTTISDEWNMENVEIVGMLINNNPGGIGEIVNGTKDHALGTVSIQNSIANESDVVVYPNPTSDQVNIKAGTEIQNIWVYNHIGQLIMKTSVSSTVKTLDLSGLQAGMYLFRIETEAGTQVESVILE